MKSPICYLCHKDFRSHYFHACAGGKLVRFADYKPLPEACAGHPQGLEWFCSEHLAAAQNLSSVSSAAAHAKLVEQFGAFPPYEDKPLKDPELWVVSVGPSPAKVFAILRDATSLPPKEAKAVLASRQFIVAKGWPASLKGWQAALSAVGAITEIRYP
jgi:hypothetical protein